MVRREANSGRPAHVGLNPTERGGIAVRAINLCEGPGDS